MSSSKRIKLTDHFKITSKPRDPFRNISNQHQQLKQQQPENQKARLPELKGPQQQPENQIARVPELKGSQQHHEKQKAPVSELKSLQQQQLPSLYTRHLVSNIFWESHYAWDCFEYDRQQEIKFKLHRDALYKLNNNNNNEIQRLPPQRWAELVDWLVNIQIRFGLEHEPVYMAVKLADSYLAHKFVADDQDVLLFIVTILISAKFDERVPPLIISDLTKQARLQFGVRYSRKQVISFEIDLLTTLNFHIRPPLSYGFLRRFAMCTRSDIRTLHLARYILESSLMEHDMIEILDSKIAAGSLLLAFKMLHQNGAWTDTAVYYSGYKEKELDPLVKRLNELIIVLSKKKTTIRQKYRHESFKEVARIPPLPTEQL